MKKKASDFIDYHISSVYENDSVSEVINQIIEKNYAHIIVYNRNNELIGIISRKDLLDYLLSIIGKNYSGKSELKFEEDQASSLMTKNPFVLHKDDEVEDIYKLIIQHNFHSIPVVDDENEVLGVINFKGLLEGINSSSEGGTSSFDYRNHALAAAWLNDLH